MSWMVGGNMHLGIYGQLQITARGCILIASVSTSVSTHPKLMAWCSGPGLGSSGFGHG